MYAAINGHYEAVKFLIGAGASIEEKDDVSERMFIRTIYIYMCVCVCVLGRGGGYSSIIHFILLQYFSTVCRI